MGTVALTSGLNRSGNLNIAGISSLPNLALQVCLAQHIGLIPACSTRNVLTQQEHANTLHTDGSKRKGTAYLLASPTEAQGRALTGPGQMVRVEELDWPHLNGKALPSCRVSHHNPMQKVCWSQGRVGVVP